MWLFFRKKSLYGIKQFFFLFPKKIELAQKCTIGQDEYLICWEYENYVGNGFQPHRGTFVKTKDTEKELP